MLILDKIYNHGMFVCLYNIFITFLSFIIYKRYADEFIPTVGKRGAAIIEARGLSSAASAANACLAHNKDWELNQNDDWKSMAICSNGEYGIEKGLFFSYPVTNRNEKYEIVQGIPTFNSFQEEKIAITERELKEERDSVTELLPN